MIDWPGIRAAAVVIGVRAAARQAASNLSADEQDRFVERVMKRSSREGWIVDKDATIDAHQNDEKTLSANVRTGADALANTLADENIRTKLGFSRVAVKVAEKAGTWQPGRILNKARELRDVATIAGKVHGWDESKGDDRRVMINVGILME